MVCTRDNDVYCGNAWRNSIYDLTAYKLVVDCTETEPKDCSQKGGYDETDSCH